MDYHGHSLSVSDVILLNQAGKISAHYVDSIGFRELSGFQDKQERSSVLSQLKAKCDIMNRLNIIKPSAKADAEHEIDDFISNWKLLATQSKGLRYYVYTTKTYNRLMNTYGEVCTDLEKPTLRSMRDVESAANMFYCTED